MLHYHGTPITPNSLLIDLMSGRNLTVSFARPDQVKLAHQIAQSVMIDNGAYSFWTRQQKIHWADYYRFCEVWLQYHSTWAVIPDIIDATEFVNDKLIQEWPFGTRGSPVWHLHESIERLVHLATTWPRICIGSSGQYTKHRTEHWFSRMDEAFESIVDIRGVPITWVHALRGMHLVNSRYPIASVDSASFGRNLRRELKKQGIDSLRKRLIQIDSTQSPCVFSSVKIASLVL